MTRVVWSTMIGLAILWTALVGVDQSAFAKGYGGTTDWLTYVSLVDW